MAFTGASMGCCFVVWVADAAYNSDTSILIIIGMEFEL